MLVCENLSFAASEAYKLLRANLTFALADVEKSPIVGITSSTRGEAKTTTAINLAYTIAETGKKVLLVDGDMRLPNIARVLQTKKAPGLSNIIAGLNTIDECVQNIGLLENWDVLPSGDIPPNPSELLNSESMVALIDKLREEYEFVVFDLPPVGIVSDALVAAQNIDGLVVVARQDYTSRKGLGQCISQLSPLKEKVLGIVFTDASKNNKSRYYRAAKYRYSKHYGYNYGYSYGYAKSRAKAKKSASDEKEAAAEKSE